ncbi:MAG TPA: polysaccharide deacetylase family protein [Terriglobales bacterium]|nr:polysaccharide deacetylase family protein [Terriglobales bacterium]
MLGLAVGISGALVYAGYHTMAPRSQLYGKTFLGHRDGRREIALTYDDGPNDPHTFHLMEVLAKHDVRATFFLVGKYVDHRPDIVRELVKAGHVVGNHTYTHPNLIFRSQSQVREELLRCERALDNAVGNQHAKLFRPPFGGRTPFVLRTVRSEGFTPVMWNVTGFDWKLTSAEAIVNRVTPQVRGGDVILLHDGGHLAFGTNRSHTVRATEKLLEKFRSEGYVFKTIPEMMAPASRPQTAAV